MPPVLSIESVGKQTTTAFCNMTQGSVNITLGQLPRALFARSCLGATHFAYLLIYLGENFRMWLILAVLFRFAIEAPPTM